jgi:hypothetical protein
MVYPGPALTPRHCACERRKCLLNPCAVRGEVRTAENPETRNARVRERFPRAAVARKGDVSTAASLRVGGRFPPEASSDSCARPGPRPVPRASENGGVASDDPTPPGRRRCPGGTFGRVPGEAAADPGRRPRGEAQADRTGLHGRGRRADPANTLLQDLAARGDEGRRADGRDLPRAAALLRVPADPAQRVGQDGPGPPRPRHGRGDPRHLLAPLGRTPRTAPGTPSTASSGGRLRVRSDRSWAAGREAPPPSPRRADRPCSRSRSRTVRTALPAARRAWR